MGKYFMQNKRYGTLERMMMSVPNGREPVEESRKRESFEKGRRRIRRKNASGNGKKAKAGDKK